jgi:hypothetical protein
MPPKKTSETKAPGKGEATKKKATSKAAPKKDDESDDTGDGSETMSRLRGVMRGTMKDSDEEAAVTKSPGHLKKEAVKNENVDEGSAENIAEVVAEAETVKRGPGRPSKKDVKAASPQASGAEQDVPEPTIPRGRGRPRKNAPPQTTPAKKSGGSQATGKTGGWNYTTKGTIAESKMVDRGFDWVSTHTLKK